ncbi:UAP56-interacting factor-like isoform X2 [Elgaria multicarinata webbii]|uniref:UAP56-interacting factor-like isoform X2 n=1 Tax=Elgaria multicarinata webbii TaxID=159646 RepID=UPI002FCCF10E
MEAPRVGGQEPEAGAAGTAGSGPAAPAEEEIDLSLDDIIKRNKKGQTNPKRNRWRQQLKNRNPAYGNGRPRFRSWVPRNLQGPNRFRGGFRKPQYYKKPFWNGVSRPGQRAAIGPNGISPLNRPASAQQGKQDESTLIRNSRNGPAADAQQGLLTRVQQFRTAGTLPPAQRPFQLNRRPPFFQRQSRFNFSRQGIKLNAEGKPSRMRRWQPQPSSGAVLTVSVSNPQASQMNMPGAKRPFLRRRNAPPKMTRRQPRGVPLRFNFRAMANQTSLTLNERFSGLRNKRQYTALRNTGRMVTLP